MTTNATTIAEAFRNLAIAIAASRRLGWIALGIYIERMKTAAPKNPYYTTMLDYHRAMGDDYYFIEKALAWADDYRMVLFPDEFSARLDAIDENWGHIYQKEMQKALIIRRMQRARMELEDVWAAL